MMQIMNVDVFIRTEQLRSLWEDTKERLQNFASTAQNLSAHTLELDSSKEFQTEYFWTINVSSFIGEQIQALLDWVRDLENMPRVGNEHGVNPNFHSPAETSNTHRISHQVPGHPFARAAQPAAIVTHAAISDIGSYKATFATLAAIAFLGASLASNTVFTGARGDLVILAWASAAFITGSIAAGSMGIIVDSDRIDLDRDMGARRAIRSFAIMSALMTFVGIILLGVATATVEPTYVDVVVSGDTSSRRLGMQAAGWFVVVVVVVEIFLAVTVRIMHHTGP